MARKTLLREIIEILVILVVGIVVVWGSLMLAFGDNPFYVVVSGSMVPELLVYDVLVVQGHAPFDEVEIGDIIVFDRPSDHSRVIVHRVVSIISEDPTMLRTKGDANSASIPGTDFPITEEEYKGTVIHVIPQVGYITQVIKPPINYIIIAIVISIMIMQAYQKRRKAAKHESMPQEYEGLADPLEDVPDTTKADSEYARHSERSNSARPGNGGGAKPEDADAAKSRDEDGRNG